MEQLEALTESGINNLPNGTSHHIILLVDNAEVDRAVYTRFLRTPFPGSGCHQNLCQFIEAETGEEALGYC